MENYEVSALSMNYEQSEDKESEESRNHVSLFSNSKRLLDYYVQDGFLKPKVFEVYTKVIAKFVYSVDDIQSLLDIFKQKSHLDKVLLIDVYNNYLICGDSGPIDKTYSELFLDAIDNFCSFANIYSDDDPQRETFNSKFSAHFFFNHEINVLEEAVVCVKGLNRYLAIVYVMRAEIFKKQALIEYNFNCIQKAIDDIMKLHKETTGYLDSSDSDSDSDTGFYDLSVVSDKVYCCINKLL